VSRRELEVPRPKRRHAVLATARERTQHEADMVPERHDRADRSLDPGLDVRQDRCSMNSPRPPAPSELVVFVAGQFPEDPREISLIPTETMNREDARALGDEAGVIRDRQTDKVPRRMNAAASRERDKATGALTLNLHGDDRQLWIGPVEEGIFSDGHLVIRTLLRHTASRLGPGPPVKPSRAAVDRTRSRRPS